MTSYLFVVVMNRLTGYGVPVNATTVRIMTCRAVDVYNSLTEKSRFIPGLEGWLGMQYVRAPISRSNRARPGKSSYSFRRRLRMAYSSVIPRPHFPLRLAVKFGMLVAAVGMVLAGGLVLQKLLGSRSCPAIHRRSSRSRSSAGSRLRSPASRASHIGRILAEVQQRPLFVVREVYGDVRAFDAPTLRGNNVPAVIAARPVQEPERPRKQSASG